MTLLTRVDCTRRLAIGVPEEWPSRRQLQTEPGLQAGWYFYSDLMDLRFLLMAGADPAIQSQLLDHSCRP